MQEAESKVLNKDVINKIDTMIKDEMDKNRIQGLSIALVDKDGVFWSRGYGKADKKNNINASPQTLYRVASVTKPFTATAIMILVDRGKLDLDTPVKEFIPNFSIKSIYKETGPITVRDLLNHHSGLKRDHYKGIMIKNPPDLDFLVDELKNDYLALPTDTLYKYSNIGYALLGKIIENVSGKTYREFMEEEVFQPLGMTDTFIGLNERNSKDISKAYELKGIIFKKAVEIEQIPYRDLPAGSIISNVEDSAKFVQMILNRGKNLSGEQILSKESLESMFSIQYPDNELDDDPYGLGWKINKVHIPNIEMNIRHGGTLKGFSTLIVAAPEEQLGVVIYYNTNHIFSRHYIANEALRLLAKAEKKDTDIFNKKHEEQALVLNSINYKKYTGKYVGIGDLPLVMDLKIEKDKLVLSLLGQDLSLKAVTESRYRVVKELLFFDINVGQFMGVDNVFLDFYSGKDGIIYPRLILKYKNLEMKIYFEKVEPYQLPDSILNLAGKYKPAKSSLPYINKGSFSEFELKIQDGWVMMNTTWEGNDFEFLLKPVNENQLITYGSGEMLTIKDNKIIYSGLVFERD